MIRRHTRYLVPTLLGGLLLPLAPAACNGVETAETAAPAEEVGAAASAVGQCNATFAPAVQYAAGVLPLRLRAADLNGDGKPDLAVVNPLPAGTVSVLLNQGSGTFAAPAAYPAGGEPLDVVVADLNGDGFPDLACADYKDGVDVLFNQGNGTFAAPVHYLAGTKGFGIAVADLDGDHKPDLAVINDAGTVSVLLNQGNGTFAAPANYATEPVAGLAVAVVAADLNNDGKLDLVVTTSHFDVEVLLNQGNGTFAAAVGYAAGPNPTAVAVVDLNGDGKPDLAVTDYSGGVSVLQNQGNGTFAATSTYAAGPDAASIVVADLNGDGSPDLVVGDYAGGVSVLQNQGNGTFAAPVTYLGSELTVSAVAADLNGDGSPDLVVADFNNNRVSVLLSTSACACYINGAVHAPGAVNPANACQVCTPTTSTTAWSSEADGTACSDGHVCTVGDACTAGACVGGPPSNGPGCAPVTKIIQRPATDTSGTVSDAMLAYSAPGSSYGGTASLPVGAVGGASRIVLLSFDLGAIPAGALITSATATLYVYLSNGSEETRAHLVDVPWDESTVTLMNLGGSNPNKVQFAVSATFPGVANVANGAPLVPVQADFTALAQGWYGAPAANFGVLLEANLTVATQNLTGGTGFCSSEWTGAGTAASGPTERPALTVTYIPNY